MNIYKFIESVVDSMRANGKITQVNAIGGGVFELNLSTVKGQCSILDLKAGDYITITNTANYDGGYKILSVDEINKTIQIAIQSVPASLGSFAAVKPYYDYNTWSEESSLLSAKTASTIFNSQLFPLVFLLVSPTGVRGGNPIYETFNTVDLYFFDKTPPDKNKRSNWRIDNIITPNIVPMVNLFISKLKLKASGQFTSKEQFLPYFGQEDKNQNKLNKVIDAVKVSINDLTILNDNSACSCAVNVFL